MVPRCRLKGGWCVQHSFSKSVSQSVSQSVSHGVAPTPAKKWIIQWREEAIVEGHSGSHGFPLGGQGCAMGYAWLWDMHGMVL